MESCGRSHAAARHQRKCSQGGGPTAETKDPYGNVRIGASATTKIKRSDFGLTWNVVLEAGGIAVGGRSQDRNRSFVNQVLSAANFRDTPLTIE